MGDHIQPIGLMQACRGFGEEAVPARRGRLVGLGRLPCRTLFGATRPGRSYEPEGIKTIEMAFATTAASALRFVG